MGSSALDLTRHDGGDVLGARLPAAVERREQAALELVERAVERWALGPCRDALAEAATTMLAQQVDVEPLDMCVRISSDRVTVAVGDRLHEVSLSSCQHRVPAAA